MGEKNRKRERVFMKFQTSNYQAGCWVIGRGLDIPSLRVADCFYKLVSYGYMIKLIFCLENLRFDTRISVRPFAVTLRGPPPPGF